MLDLAVYREKAFQNGSYSMLSEAYASVFGNLNFRSQIFHFEMPGHSWWSLILNYIFETVFYFCTFIIYSCTLYSVAGNSNTWSLCGLSSGYLQYYWRTGFCFCTYRWFLIMDICSVHFCHNSLKSDLKVVFFLPRDDLNLFLLGAWEHFQPRNT